MHEPVHDAPESKVAALTGSVAISGIVQVYHFAYRTAGTPFGVPGTPFGVI